MSLICIRRGLNFPSLDLLAVVDMSALVLGSVFFVLAVLIRKNIVLPQNNVLLVVGSLLLVFLAAHLQEYFPEAYPSLDEDVSHTVRDISLFLTVSALVWYGATTYGYVRKTTK